MQILNDPAVAQGVTVADFKTARGIAADDVRDDAELAGMVAAAEAAVCRAAGHYLTTRHVRFDLHHYGWCRWFAPVRPVTGLVKTEVFDGAGAWSEVATDGAWIEAGHDEPQIYFGADWAGWSHDPTRVAITLETGGDFWGSAQLKQAAILLAAEWYDAGAAVEAYTMPRLSMGVRRLVQSVQYRRRMETSFG